MTENYGFGDVDPVALRAGGEWKWVKYEADVCAAWVADMDFAVAPPISAALRAFTDRNIHGYAPWSFSDELKEVFCKRVNRLFSSGAEPDMVRLCSDVVQALHATVFAFSAPKEKVLLLTPLYPPFAAAAEANLRDVVEHRMAPDAAGLWRVDREKLRAQIIAERPSLFLLCSPHNPVGRLWDRDELEFFASLATEFDMVVVADEIHAELVFCDRPMIAFSSLGEKIRARTVTITSANKAFNLAGLKVAMICFGSQTLKDRFSQAIPGAILGAVSTAGLVATKVALVDCDDWLDHVHTYLSDNIVAFGEAMSQRVPSVRVTLPEATYLAWLDFSSVPGVAGTSVGTRLREEGRVALNEGETFGAGLEHFARINLATSRAIVMECVERISRWVEAQFA